MSTTTTTGKYSLSFEQCEEKLRNFISYYANKFARFSHLSVADDFKQMALMAIWECLPNFRLVCPVCNEKFNGTEEYSEHTHRGTWIAPKFGIITYLQSRILSLFQREVKKELGTAKRRGNTISLSIKGGYATHGPSNDKVSLEQSLPDETAEHFISFQIEFEEILNKIVHKFSNVQREIVDMYIKQNSVSEIMREMEGKCHPSLVRTTIIKFKEKIEKFYLNAA